ncbi:MAG TPA: ATP-binding protein [Anaerolineales bacterium]|nr:ATP-binding protein [Anaerolineales bacterium]
MSVDFLRRLPLFGGLSGDDLQRLCEMAEEFTIRPDNLLIEEGAPGDSLYIVLEGEFEISKHAGQDRVVIATRGAGEVIGEMSLLAQSPRTANVRALRESRVLMISQASFKQLLSRSPDAVLAILATFTSRLRDSESLLRQHEKMASLGTIAAGLAHELNNPAAAMQRSAAQLREELESWQSATARLFALGLTPSEIETLARLRTELAGRVGAPASLDILALSDREAELQDWLEERDLPEAFEIAPALVASGWDVESMAGLSASFSAEKVAPVARWLGIGCLVHGLIEELRISSGAISELVRAVKAYSFLDQAPVQDVDIHEGLENTLVILRHKLEAGIHIVREYAPDLPRIEAYASELNQVWTNIIDNAIDAMQGKGELSIRTYPEDAHVVVEIQDSGPGIPQEVEKRIFEPFFTTKPQGIGTGLGLHISYNIVVQKHKGQLRVSSSQEGTCFQITLPFRLGPKT